MNNRILKTAAGFAGTERGFTLVELVTASVILLIGVLGVVGITRSGRVIDISAGRRRVVRTIIMNRFESPQYHYTQYQTLFLKAGTGAVTSQVTVDNRGTAAAGDDLVGTLSETVGVEQTAAGDHGINVPYLPVTIALVWNEPEGPDTVILSKWIAQ